MASNSPKNRDYFITINEGAPCYEKALEILKEMNFVLYAYIVHDKDFEVGDNGDLTPKKTHKHIMVELKNPISFASVQKRFEGAHIEVPKYKKSAYQYLIHNLESAREKYQYSTTEIISNNPEEVKLIIETEQVEQFFETQFMTYIVDGTITPYRFVKRFGLNAYKQYWSVYFSMLQEMENDSEMLQDYEVIKTNRKDSNQ